jgi:O-antigen ligase
VRRAEDGIRTAAYGIAVATALGAVLALGGTHSYAWVPAVLVLCATLVGVLTLLNWRHKRLPLPWILFPMLGFGLLVCGQSVASSVYPGLTRTGLIQLAGCAAIFYLALIAFRDPANLRRLSFVIWVFSGAVASEAILQFATSAGKIYWVRDANYGTPSGPFIYHNHYAACMALLLPMAWIHALRPENKPGVIWLRWLRRSIGPILGMLSVAMAQSRSGVFTLGFEMILALILFWRPGRVSKKGYAAAAAVGVVMLLFASLIPWTAVIARFDRLSHRDLSSLNRIAVTESCMRILRDHPWLGTGFDTFSAVYPAYRSFDNGLVFEQAHNDYAQVLAETGIAGGLLVALFLVTYLARGVQLFRQGGQPEIQGIQQGALLGTLGMLFIAGGDFPFHNPSLALLFFLLAGACLARPRGGRRHLRATRSERRPRLIHYEEAEAGRMASR